MTRTTTGGDLLVGSLIAQGVHRVFGIPGIQLDGATDALYRRSEEIDFICARNEQATTYMADGYARSTGEVGVAMVVPGPGVLNALAGLATAYANNSRVLLIAGQIPSGSIDKGLGALHEIPDQTAILRGLTKWTGRARSADEVPGVLETAFRQLRSGRPRPVAVEIPPDVLAATSDAIVRPVVAPAPTIPGRDAIRAAASLLREAERPLIIAGGGVIAADGSAELTTLAEALEAPVVMTEDGRGAIDARHRLAFDWLALRELRGSADMVLGVGTRFVTTFGSPVDSAGAPVILLNADIADLGAPRHPELAILSDARVGIDMLTAELATSSSALRPRRTDLPGVRDVLKGQLDDIAPQREYLAAIRSVMPEDGVLVSEFTQVGYAASVCFAAYGPRTYIGPGYEGTLGFGFATALGVKAARPERAVVSINGDGGFSWTLQELSTMKRYGLSLAAIVFEDGYYGNVRRIQKNDYQSRFFASDLTNPDYPRLAEAFGISWVRATSADALATVLDNALRADEPTLIHVPVGEFPSPWHLIHDGVPRPEPLGADAYPPPGR